MTHSARPLLRPTSVVAAAAAVLALAGVGGCGNAAVPVPPPVASAPASPGSTSSSSASPVPDEGEATQVDGRTVLVPPGLRFPPASKVTNAFLGTVILGDPAPEATLDWFRAELPKADYVVVNDGGGVLSFIGRGWSGSIITDSSSTTVTFAADTEDESSAEPDDPGPMTPLQLGLHHVPFFLRFPPGTELTDVADPPSGASVTIVAPEPSQVLAFYRASLPIGHFTVTGESTTGAETTVTFSDDDGWTGRLVVGDDDARLTTKKP